MRIHEEYLVVVAALLIAGCTTKNNVTRIEQADSIIKYRESTDVKRFANLYPGKKSYPITCTNDCYKAVAQVQCEVDAENCTYVGEQNTASISTPSLSSSPLNMGFDIQWLGHASFYIKSPDGSKLLIDPVSQQFDWPVNWGFRLSEGFNRQEPNWLTPDEFSDVDAVMYSHIHYDHFNKDEIERIGNKPEYLVPLAFPKNAYKINEMAWFSTKKINQALNVSFVPAHHFSSRIWVPFLYEDNDKSLWGGWLLEHQGKRVFFAGDTGYSKHFSDIQQRYGDMDVCLMPIASYYHPESGDWYRYVHTTPEDALIAAKEMKCKVMIPWGYGNSSWKMGDHSSHSPLIRLLNMHKQMNSEISLYILNEGETIRL